MVQALDWCNKNSWHGLCLDSKIVPCQTRNANANANENDSHLARPKMLAWLLLVVDLLISLNSYAQGVFSLPWHGYCFTLVSQPNDLSTTYPQTYPQADSLWVSMYSLKNATRLPVSLCVLLSLVSAILVKGRLFANLNLNANDSHLRLFGPRPWLV
jgi:hypothetical protein